MPGRQFYVWQAQSFTVQVSLELIDELNRAIGDPRQREGAELGGILFGHVLGPLSIELTSFEFVASEHHRGTIFALGLRERQRIARYVASRHRDRDASPVGFFRTHLRPGLFLDQDDFALMTEAFADPSQIALLIRPGEGNFASAGIFLWDEGDIDRRQTPFAFPLDSGALRQEGPIRIEEIRPSTPVLPKVRLPEVSAAVLTWSAAALTAIGLVAVGYEYRSRVFRKEPDRPLNVQLKHKGDALVVDWDKRATALKHAPSAVLTINDGGSTQELKLDRSDLDYGKVQFWPRTKDVSVQMDLGTQHYSTSRAATPALSAKPEASRQISAEKPSPLDIGDGRVGSAPASRRKAKAPKAARALAGIVAAAARPKPVARDLAEMEAAPELAPEPGRLTPVSVPVHRRSVAVSVVLEPKQPSEFRKVVSHVPLFGRSFRAEGGSDFSPARPQRPLEPQLPPGVAEDLSRDVSVDVKVSIDKHGSVKNAQVLNGSKSELASLAANAAGATSWDPARQGERTVSSDVIVHYRFSPSN